MLLGIGETMAVTTTKMSSVVVALGLLSFIFGILAEHNKPASGTPIIGKNVVICKYPSDPTMVWGYLSIGFLAASTLVGFLSVFYPYQGKSVPNTALFQSTSLLVFFNIALVMASLGAALLLWPTVTEQLHLRNKVHHNLNTTCPTAKTGLLGGGALVSFCSSLFWLIAHMLTDNAREDYLEEEADPKGKYGQVTTTADFEEVAARA